MKSRIIRPLFLLILILTALTQISCSKSVPPSPGNPPKINEAGENEKWKQLGPDNAEINQIQVTSDGSVYLLSEKKLYLLGQEEFINIGPQAEVSIFYVLENNKGKQIFAAGDKGEIYLKSGEGTWEKTNSPVIRGEPVSAIAGDIKTGIVYLGQSTKKGGGLWKSADAGKTWKKLTNTTVRSVVVHPQESEFLYIIDKATFLSEDGGRRWEKIETPANYGLLIHPLDSKTINIAYSKGVVSADLHGVVKENISFDLNGTMTCLELNFIRFEEWAVAMWDYPSGSGGLYISFDEGTNWMKVDDTLDKARILDMRFDNKGDKLYIGTAGRGLWVLNLQKIR